MFLCMHVCIHVSTSLIEDGHKYWEHMSEEDVLKRDREV